jgi:hypothetical protein
MKNIALVLLIFISFTGFGQRKIPMATRYCPKMENQVTKEDSLKDESTDEYKEVEFKGVELDTATINEHFRKMEELQKDKITPVDKPDGPNLEEIYWLDLKDMEKISKEAEEKSKIKKEEKVIVKPK